MSRRLFKFQNSVAKIILIAIGLVCAILFFLGAKWAYGNALATRGDTIQVGELSTNLAPADPLTHTVLAVLNDKEFSEENWKTALSEYEKAASLSPNDYRLWFQLGKARERLGDAAGAETALRKSLELAPNYSEVQWALGNLLLRKGDTAQAFGLVRQAAEGNEKFALPVITTAWQIFDGDLAQVKQNIGESPQAKVALLRFLISRKSFDEAFEIWNSLPPEEQKTTFQSQGEAIYHQLAVDGKFRFALKVWAVTLGENRNYEIGKITDGGFESNEKHEKVGTFDWQIADGTQPLIGIDTVNVHEGTASRKIIFNSPNGTDFRAFNQTVAVEPGRKYEFSIFYKSDLKSAAPLLWEIVNPHNGIPLGKVQTESGKADWTNAKTEFTVPENLEGIIIRLSRGSCGSAVCPMTGSIWFDDFTLTAK